MDKWTLDLAATRASYDPTSADDYFTLAGIAEKSAGKTDYLLSLVLNTTDDTNPSSSPRSPSPSARERAKRRRNRSPKAW